MFSGVLQVLLYADFFYLYIKNFSKILSSDLPTINDKPVPVENKETDNVIN